MKREPLPLASLQNAVLEFLKGRKDSVVYGAQAVNAYVPEPRMTEDIDLICTRARELAQELRDLLASRFHIAVRIREVSEGRGLRLYQVRKPKNRHLVDIRAVEQLPAFRRIAQVAVLAPAELIAAKVIAYHDRKGQPKSGTDWRDLAVLLLRFPDLKADPGPVNQCLQAANAGRGVLVEWKKLAAQKILPEEE